MKVRQSAVVSAFATILILVVLPFVVLRLLPDEMLSQLESSGFSLQSFVVQMAMLGFIVAAITLVKGIFERTSITYLILDVLENIVSLIFTFFIIGVGNIGNLGFTSFRIVQGNLTANIILDIRFFLWVAMVVVGLRVVSSIVEFNEEKTEVTVAPKG